MNMKSPLLWELSVTVKNLIKKASTALLSFNKIEGEILEAEQKMYASFRRMRGLGHMTVSEMLSVMHKNDLLDTFPKCSKVAHIAAVIPATSCSTKRSFSTFGY